MAEGEPRELTPEEQWLSAQDPQEMLSLLEGLPVSQRKLRIFTVLTMCSAMGRAEITEGDRDLANLALMAIDKTGKIIDGEPIMMDIERMGHIAARLRARQEERPNTFELILREEFSFDDVQDITTMMMRQPDVNQQYLQQEELIYLHDIFGNPFHSVEIPQEWRTSTVTALAQAAYEERNLSDGRLNNDRLAVLADALEDAGCDNAEILNHLRGSGSHVRGCWCLDVILQK
jgi:hypothetical protein